MFNSVTKNKKAILQETAQGAKRLENMPFYYAIHLNRLCNQKCIMCKPDGKHPKDTLPFNQFELLFDQIKPFAEHITLMGGEPSIYPQIEEVIDVLSRHQIAVTMNTNATHLSQQLTQKMLKLHELNLKCSIHGPDEETYYKIHGSKLFTRVVKNISYFAKASKHLPNIKLIFVYVMMKENLPAVLPFIDFAKTFSPHRIEFHTVKHVQNWKVENGTGWFFDGKHQSCEFIGPAYNQMMRQAVEECEKENIDYEVSYL